LSSSISRLNSIHCIFKVFLYVNTGIKGFLVSDVIKIILQHWDVVSVKSFNKIDSDTVNNRSISPIIFNTLDTDRGSASVSRVAPYGIEAQGKESRPHHRPSKVGNKYDVLEINIIPSK
jgi:hypothetical protein